MPRLVRAGLIQAGVGQDAPQDLGRLKKFMIDKHVSENRTMPLRLRVVAISDSARKAGFGGI